MAGENYSDDHALREGINSIARDSFIAVLFSCGAFGVAAFFIPHFFSQFEPSLILITILLINTPFRRWLKYSTHLILLKDKVYLTYVTSIVSLLTLILSIAVGYFYFGGKIVNIAVASVLVSVSSALILIIVTSITYRSLSIGITASIKLFLSSATLIIPLLGTLVFNTQDAMLVGALFSFLLANVFYRIFFKSAFFDVWDILLRSLSFLRVSSHKS